MIARRVTPILNVSDAEASVTWFLGWGWTAGFRWGEPFSFGSVYAGDVEVFLCLDGQGGRGKGENATTFGAAADERADRGAWMSLWVDDVDAIHRTCLAGDIEITHPPTDMPWGVREMHVRHPDGHVFRVTQPLVAER